MDSSPLRRTMDRLKLESLRRRKREHLEWVDRTRGVGYLISRARNHARLSQEQLAKEMHTTQSTVSRWECGHQLPSLLTLERVAIATDLQLEVAFQSRDGSGDFCCAAVLRDEGNMTELEILKNWSHENIEWPPVEDPPRRVDTFKGRPSGDGW